MDKLKAEWLKIYTYRTFWIGFIVYFVLLGFILTGFLNININFNGDGQEQDLSHLRSMFYSFPAIWHYFTYISSYLGVLLLFLIVILTANEFEYKTLRMAIINGWSRLDFLLAKTGLAALLSLAATLFVIIMALVLGSSYGQNNDDVSPFSGITYAGLYFLQVFAYLIFGILITIIIKRTGLSIAAVLVYAVIIEPYTASRVSADIRQWLPLHSINKLIPNPLLGEQVVAGETLPGLQAVMLPVIYTLIFILLAYLILKKRDL